MDRALIAAWLRRPAALAAVCGVAAVLCIAFYFRWREGAIGDLGRPVRCLVAARDLPTQTQLTAAVVSWLELPRQFAPVHCLTDARAAIGLITQAPLMKDEPITPIRIRPPGDGSGFAGMIPPGRRAISIPVDAVSGVAGLVEPGNWVDCIATFDFGDAANAQSFTMTLLAGVPVLAVDQRVRLREDLGVDGTTKKIGKEVEQTVTMALTPEQVQRVIFAQETGRLRLALRAQADGEGREGLALPDPATAASVTGMSGLVRRKEYRGR